MGWEGLSVTIERPDGQTETISDIRTDSTGGTGVLYVPTMVGTYRVQVHFPEQVTAENKAVPGLPEGSVMLASESEVLELVVQEEPIQYYPGHPLPNEYWNRPINAQFHEWVPITGNWLRPAGGYTMPPIPKYHPNNADAPETAHLLWTKQYAPGGLTGDVLGNVQYEMGDAYEGKFSGSVIINGVLYYNRFQSQGGSNVDQEVVAVNLKTGEELWVKNWDNRRLAFGQVFYFSAWNYHGAFAYLWTTEGGAGMFGPPEPEHWYAYDALTGRWCYSIRDVPQGWNLYGKNGAIYRYTVNLEQGWMTLWNQTKTVQPQDTGGPMDGSWQPLGNVYNASRGIEWNVTIPKGLPGQVCAYFLDELIFGSTAGGFGTTGQPITSWAISVKPGEEGRLIFNTTWALPEDDLTVVWTDASVEDGVFILSGKENRKYYGFSLETGELLWETEPEHYLAIYDKWYGPAIAYGKFYTGRQSGIVTCYDIKTGEKLWAYEVKDKYAEITWSNNWPIRFDFIADGKIYLSYAEHSPINPMPRGAPYLCLNATTGEVIWELSWMGNWWGGHTIIGDSTMVGMNAYDNRLYAIGKGPSKITATIEDDSINLGDSAIVKGKVVDIAPGTEDPAIKMRFPDGVPAVADESMTDWMQYVYMQFERPETITGVTVKIEAIDPNGNYQNYGTATTDPYGNYGLTFKPEIPSQYMIIATFEGTKSYYPSTVTTYLTVEETSPATIMEPEQPATEAPAITTEVTIIIGILVGCIVGATTVWALQKRK